MHRSHARRHLRELADLLPAGWAIAGRTKRNHLRLQGPEGQLVIASATPGPFDAWRATLAKIHRAERRSA